jgi:hypothetical protein
MHQRKILGQPSWQLTRDDLASATTALRGALDDPGQVEELDARALVLDHARDRGERGELVCGGLGLGVRGLGEERALADGGEADQRDARVAGLADVEPDAGGPGLGRGLEQLRAVAGELGLEQPEVVLGRLLRGEG